MTESVLKVSELNEQLAVYKAQRENIKVSLSQLDGAVAALEHQIKFVQEKLAVPVPTPEPVLEPTPSVDE